MVMTLSKSGDEIESQSKSFDDFQTRNPVSK